ncbi:3-hydroxybutyryl-CoA dehydrogenase [Rhodovulum sp. 12E13]|uniref:3-hydroxyacyl-CoA dehydrogenase n=1 Tax=Rhodovulum sp. 12E13 TaxID=2203891 RepID=UPI000E158078|nr:3-hydroxyacyl-CoA dehydrogenase NAD-binding domain-containing protein [Rhodovulum sp. 12E13]RDC71814.1 3-hydroxybutyryl-CoA dehydrogenase [Rhodovulum sp. 12E13]
MERIGVVGAGAMGRGIAQVAAQAGCAVTLTDVSEPALEAARDAIGASLSRAVRKGKLPGEDAAAALGRIVTGTELACHAGAELVIEAAVERLDVKAAIFRELARAAPGAVRASNTSSLAIREIAGAAGTPLIGLHFFNPAHAMKLVEVILPDGAEGLAPMLEQTLRAWGKTPVRAPDSPGFIVNRCARPFYGEALAMLEEGAKPAAIDAAMVAAGYRMGPFALIDLVGADVNLAASESVARAMGGHPRYHVFDALRRQVVAGRLGRKSGEGFVTPDPGAAGPAPGAAERIEAALVNEAASLLAEGVAEDDIDTAMRLGLNFPRGPFEIARAAGPAAIVARLEALEAAAPAHLKGRYAPAAALRAMESA